MCPNREWNWQPFGLQDDAPINRATLAAVTLCTFASNLGLDLGHHHESPSEPATAMMSACDTLLLPEAPTFRNALPVSHTFRIRSLWAVSLQGSTAAAAATLPFSPTLSLRTFAPAVPATPFHLGSSYPQI